MGKGIGSVFGPERTGTASGDFRVPYSHMTEIALYRKYRPKKFSEVLGQEHIVSVLEGSASEKTPSHAYLFSGSRGTGKTTIARIFASELGTKPEDIFEIDAASSRNIADVRELREAVKSLPFSSKYKVYILDEVHMFTKDSWNALLKTLEEPPEHVIFILATTELEKVPETIISRCQSFVFAQPDFATLKDFVRAIAKKEGRSIDAPSAEIIAIFGDGSFRDTLSVLEKVLSSAGESAIDADMVASVVGAPSSELIREVLRAIDGNEPERGLRAIADASARQIDMKVFLRVLLSKMRVVLILRYAPGLEERMAPEYVPEDLAFLSTLSRSESKRINSHVLEQFLIASQQVGFAIIPSLPAELALIRVTGEATSAPTSKRG